MAAYHIFAKDMQRSGDLTIWEMNLLRRLVKNWGWIPEHTFFIHTPSEEALKRLHKRDRTAEKNIKEKFLWELELRHRAFIQSGLCGHVHILDGSLSKEELLTSALSEIDAICESKRERKWIRLLWPRSPVPKWSHRAPRQRWTPKTFILCGVTSFIVLFAILISTPFPTNPEHLSLLITQWRTNAILWCLAGVSTNTLLTIGWITIKYWCNHWSTRQVIVPGVICIEGNIGSGKSTLLCGLKQRGISVFQEPVQTRWRDCLSTFYQNKSRWGFTFQVEVLEPPQALVCYYT